MSPALKFPHCKASHRAARDQPPRRYRAHLQAWRCSPPSACCPASTLWPPRAPPRSAELLRRRSRWICARSATSTANSTGSRATSSAAAAVPRSSAPLVGCRPPMTSAAPSAAACSSRSVSAHFAVGLAPCLLLLVSTNTHAHAYTRRGPVRQHAGAGTYGRHGRDGTVL